MMADDRRVDTSRTHVPGNLAGTSQLPPHLILTTYAVWVLLFPYFTDERTKHRGVKHLARSYTASQWQSWDANSAVGPTDHVPPNLSVTLRHMCVRVYNQSTAFFSSYTNPGMQEVLQLADISF